MARRAPVQDTDLFAHARTTDPSTSHEAAATVRNISRTKASILALLRISGPMTDDELIARFKEYGWAASPQSIRSRRSELVRDEQVRFSGAYGISELGGKSRKWEVARG